MITVFHKTDSFHPIFLLGDKNLTPSLSPQLPSSFKEVHIDKLDFDILQNLAVNARIPTVKLAHDLNITTATVKSRIKRLIDVIKREEVSENLAPNEFWEKSLMYQGLKSLIESGNGAGFHNADLGHPVYLAGAADEFQEMWEYADSPNKNRLFKMVSKLSKELKEMGIEDFRFIWWYDFSEWQDFCRFSVEVYNKSRNL